MKEMSIQELTSLINNEEKMRLNLIEMQEDLLDMSKNLKLLLDTLNNVNDTEVRKFKLLSREQKEAIIFGIFFLLLVFIVTPLFIVIPLSIYAIIDHDISLFIAIVIVSIIAKIKKGDSGRVLITPITKEFKKINISECKNKATDTLDLIESCHDVMTLALKEETLSKDTYLEIYSNALYIVSKYSDFENELT